MYIDQASIPAATTTNNKYSYQAREDNQAREDKKQSRPQAAHNQIPIQTPFAYICYTPGFNPKKAGPYPNNIPIHPILPNAVKAIPYQEGAQQLLYH